MDCIKVGSHSLKDMSFSSILIRHVFGDDYSLLNARELRKVTEKATLACAYSISRFRDRLAVDDVKFSEVDTKDHRRNF